MPTVQSLVPSLEVVYRRVEANTQYSLAYLRDFDEIIDTLTDIRNSADAICGKIERTIIPKIESGNTKRQIDPKDEFFEMAISTEKGVKKVITESEKFYGKLETSLSLTSHGEEMSDAYEQAVFSLKHLHDSMVDLRWAVMEHDANFESPSGNPFDKAEDLIADLGSE